MTTDTNTPTARRIPADETGTPVLDSADMGTTGIATRRPARRRAALLVSVAAAFGLAGFLASSDASANAVAAGTTFSTSVACDINGHYLETAVITSRFTNNSMAVRTYVQTVSSGNWVVGPWHSIVNGISDTSSDFTFSGHGYYKIYMQYAQYTTNGWVYNGEYIYSYNQHTTYGISLPSSTCYI